MRAPKPSTSKNNAVTRALVPVPIASVTTLVATFLPTCRCSALLERSPSTSAPTMSLKPSMSVAASSPRPGSGASWSRLPARTAFMPAATVASGRTTRRVTTRNNTNATTAATASEDSALSAMVDDTDARDGMSPTSTRPAPMSAARAAPTSRATMAASIATTSRGMCS
jgi:hypothetical protein